MSELYFKIETAIAAYLAQYVDGDPENPTSYWPKSLQNAAGQYRIFTGESDQTKDGQAILVIAEDSTQEEPQFTGNQHIPIQIWLRTPVAVLTPAQIAAKTATAKQNHDAAAGILSDALNQDPFLLAGYFNESGQGFTIMGGVMYLRPQRSEVAGFFASGWTFRLYAGGFVSP
jgi:hypothetical protein